MQTTSGTIIGRERSSSKSVVILHCRVDDIFDFREGQFLLLAIEINGKIIKRSYSICSSQRRMQEEGIVSFGIKHTPGGVFSARALFDAQLGDRILMTGPLGKFVDNKNSKNYLFVSVGSGLYPGLAIYNELLYSGGFHKIANLFGEKRKSDIPASVLQSYSIMTDSIYNQICLSRMPQYDSQGIFRQGRVQQALEDGLNFLSTSDITIFVCGLPAMCKDVVNFLLSQGFTQNQILIEKY